MSIEQQALELEQLRKRASDALESDDIDTWLDLIGDQVAAMERLQDALLSNSVHVVKDADARRVLKEIDLDEI